MYLDVTKLLSVAVYLDVTKLLSVAVCLHLLMAEFTVNTPHALYTQDGVGPVQFIEVIGESVWSGIEFEYELPPSFDALWHYWHRTCWVSNMWNQDASNHMRLLDLTQYCWKIVDGKLECDWESVENRETVRY